MENYFKNLIILLLLIFPSTASAAVLYFDPSEETFGLGDEFAVSVKLDVNSSCINTIEAEIEFPREQLFLKDFIIGESIISLWVDNPSLDDMPQANKNGRIHFSGGIPGGYCGKIPGDIGESNILGRLIFKLPKFVVGAEQKKELNIIFGDKTRVFQNDGFGTEDIIATRTATILVQDEAVNPELDWDYLIDRDKIPPEPFIIEVHRNDNIFAGKYYLTFNAIDKQSGVDHYEVLEIKPSEEIGAFAQGNFWQRLFFKDKEAPNWQRAQMPYVLNNQSLGGIIKVRALDRAGNVRLVEYIPPYIDTGSGPKFNYLYLIAGIIIIVILFGLIIFTFIKIFKKLKIKPHDKEDNN
ncbi:MAG: hypothetical protein U9Q85_02205 [Patescibacteria group bacterium]|nr:hypothetical protein [Patescibacteria group bacterium]